jgi:hypothetical protein
MAGSSQENKKEPTSGYNLVSKPQKGRCSKLSQLMPEIRAQLPCSRIVMRLSVVSRRIWPNTSPITPTITTIER